MITYISCLTSNCGIGRYTEELAKAMHQETVAVQLFRKNEGAFSFVKPYPYRSFKSLKHWIAPYFLKKAISQTESPVWHADHPDAFMGLVYANKEKKAVKKVVTVHDAIPLLFGHTAWWEKKRLRYHLQTVAKKADVIVTISEQSKQDLIEIAGLPEKKMNVVYNGINHETLFPDPKKKNENRPFTIRYIGGLGAAHKNAHALIETARILEDWGIEFRMEIGSGLPQGTKLPQLVAAYGLQNVRFCGFVPDGELQAFLSEADLFFYPSLYEGFGFPPLEAMACGTPVLAADVAPSREILGKAAQLAEPTAEAFATAIEKMIESASIRDDFRKRGFSQAKKYQWAHTAEKMKSIYFS